MEIFKNLDGREKCLGLHLWESWNLSAFVVAMQSLSRVWLLATPWTAAYQASLCFTVSWSLLKFMSIELVMLYNCLILCCPLLLLPSIFPSIRVFSSKPALHQSVGASPSTSVLSITIQGWFPLRLTGLILLSKGLFKSLLQHHSLQASFLWYPSFLMVQLLHSYKTTGKTTALTIRTFISKYEASINALYGSYVNIKQTWNTNKTRKPSHFKWPKLI